MNRISKIMSVILTLAMLFTLFVPVTTSAVVAIPSWGSNSEYWLVANGMTVVDSANTEMQVEGGYAGSAFLSATDSHGTIAGATKITLKWKSIPAGTYRLDVWTTAHATSNPNVTYSVASTMSGPVAGRHNDIGVGTVVDEEGMHSVDLSDWNEGVVTFAIDSTQDVTAVAVPVEGSTRFSAARLVRVGDPEYQFIFKEDFENFNASDYASATSYTIEGTDNKYIELGNGGDLGISGLSLSGKFTVQFKMKQPGSDYKGTIFGVRYDADSSTRCAMQFLADARGPILREYGIANNGTACFMSQSAAEYGYGIKTDWLDFKIHFEPGATEGKMKYKFEVDGVPVTNLYSGGAYKGSAFVDDFEADAVTYLDFSTFGSQSLTESCIDDIKVYNTEFPPPVELPIGYEEEINVLGTIANCPGITNVTGSTCDFSNNATLHAPNATGNLNYFTTLDFVWEDMPAGTYEVLFWKTAHSGDANNAKLTIKDTAAGDVVTYLDTHNASWNGTQNLGSWASLGEVVYDGVSNTITLNYDKNDSGTARISAAKVVYKSKSTLLPPVSMPVGTEIIYQLKSDSNIATNTYGDFEYAEYFKDISPTPSDWGATSTLFKGWGSTNADLSYDGEFGKFNRYTGPIDALGTGEKAIGKFEVTFKNTIAGNYELYYWGSNYASDQSNIIARINGGTGIDFSTPTPTVSAPASATAMWIKVGGLHAIGSGNQKISFEQSEQTTGNQMQMRFSAVKLVYRGSGASDEPEAPEIGTEFATIFDFVEYDSPAGAYNGSISTISGPSGTQVTNNQYLCVEGYQGSIYNANKLNILIQNVPAGRYALKYWKCSHPNDSANMTITVNNAMGIATFTGVNLNGPYTSGTNNGSWLDIGTVNIDTFKDVAITLSTGASPAVRFAGIKLVYQGELEAPEIGTEFATIFDFVEYDSPAGAYNGSISTISGPSGTLVTDNQYLCVEGYQGSIYNANELNILIQNVPAGRYALKYWKCSHPNDSANMTITVNNAMGIATFTGVNLNGPYTSGTNNGSWLDIGTVNIDTFKDVAITLSTGASPAVRFAGIKLVYQGELALDSLIESDLYTITATNSEFSITDVPYNMTVADFVYEIAPKPAVVNMSVYLKDEAAVVVTGDILNVLATDNKQNYEITVDDPWITSADLEIDYNKQVGNGLKKISGLYYGMKLDDLMDALTVGQGVETNVKRGDTVITTEQLATSDIIEVTKNGYTEKYELYVDAARFASTYAVDYSARTITIPMGTLKSALDGSITLDYGVTYRVMNGETEITDAAATLAEGYVINTVRDGVELDYTIKVELLFTSETYTVNNGAFTVGTAPKRTVVSNFLSALTPMAGVTLEVVGKTENDILENGDILVATKNGNETNYTIAVEVGNPVSEPTTENTDYTIDLEDQVISGVTKGTAVSDFKADIVASNGGTVKIFDQNMNEVTEGSLHGNETVRVYPTDVQTGQDEYEVYAIKYDTERSALNEYAIPYNDSQNAEQIGRWDVSGEVVPAGYNGLQPIIANNAESIVKFKAPVQETAEYKVYVHTSYFSSTGPQDVQIYANDGTSLTDTVNVNFGYNHGTTPNSGWVEVGTYNFNVPEDGKYGYVQIGPKIPYAKIRITAVKFVKMAVLSITEAKLTVGATDYDITDNSVATNVSADKASFSVTFSSGVDASSVTAQSIRLISENGLEIETKGQYDAETKTYSGETVNKLIEDQVYYLQVTNGVKTANGNAISNVYTYVIKTVKNDQAASSDIIYRDGSGSVLEGIEGASNVSVATELTNSSAETKTVKVVVAYFKNRMAVKVNTSVVDIPASGSINSVVNLILDAPAEGTDYTKVFVIGVEDHAPIAEVYYTK